MSPAGLPALATHTVGKEVSQSADTSAEDILATRLQQFEAVSTVTAEITRELDLTTLLGLITRRAVELIDAAVSGAILLWDETEQLLIPHAWHGYGEWMCGVRLILDFSKIEAGKLDLEIIDFDLRMARVS